MLQLPMVRWAALLWGLATFFPVGLNYAAFVLLLLALLLDGQSWVLRWARLRQSPNWWPAWAFVAWTAGVLAFGSHYPETASNAGHALRIVLTVWLVLALSGDEAIAALRGFALGVGCSLLVVGFDRLVGLPSLVLWSSIVEYGGNKSLANALLMALVATSAVLCLPFLNRWQRVAALAVLLGALATLTWVLPSRTAWLILLVGTALGVLHQLRAHHRRQAWWLAAALLGVLAVGMATPQVRERLDLGIQEIVQAHQGKAVDLNSSWGVRYRMYSLTVDMIRDRPLAGWGIGGWNEQWRTRAEPALVEVNMPHDDYLWMGAQAGIPGLLALLCVVAAGLPRAWRRPDLGGRLGMVALVGMLMALAVNSALRDASIGLSLWFVVLVYQRLSQEPDAVLAWRQALGLDRWEPRERPD